MRKSRIAGSKTIAPDVQADKWSQMGAFLQRNWHGASAKSEPGEQNLNRPPLAEDSGKSDFSGQADESLRDQTGR
jgi:hypothetical protein